MLQASFLKRYSQSKGKQGRFDGTFDPTPSFRNQVSPQQAQARQDLLSELTEQILSSYRSCPSRDHSQEIGSLAAETRESISEFKSLLQKAKRTQEAYEESAADLMHQVFDLMRAYAYEFNSEVGFYELNVTCTKPNLVTEVLRYSSYREPIETVTKLRARLSTRHMSLVIVGNKSTIEFYLIPAHKVIGLSKSELAHAPHKTLQAGFNGERIVWELDRQEITEAALKDLAQDLFRTLIELSRESVKTA